MIDYTDTALHNVSIHHVGNKTNGEELLISGADLDIQDGRLRDLLMKFFLASFTSSEYYSFTFSNQDFTLNPLYSFASEVFGNVDTFHKNSEDIAKLLYEISNHSQIKSGDLFVAYFSDLCVEDEVVNAIGIFKSENRQAFLKLDIASDAFVLNYEDGINIDKLDKGCLIFETEKTKGYKIAIVDKSNKSGEAQFWKDSFLMLRPCEDEYHQTKNFLDLTKNYVTKQLTEDFELNKTDQIDILNRSMDYFKSHDSFDKQEFEEEVFQKPEIIDSFRKFDESYRAENDMPVEDNFDINASAVKKQSRVFKSILKLDKNFHIYIHGNKDLIEQGVERDGRKFYKIYFETES